MKLPVIYTGALFEKGKRVHLIFCFGLLILILSYLWVSHQLRSLAGALFAYAYCLGCIYTGRWICRQWLRTRRWLGLIGMFVRALIIFDLAGVIGFVHFFNPELPPNHLLESGINILSLSFLLLFSGLFITITRRAIRKKKQQRGFPESRD